MIENENLSMMALNNLSVTKLLSGEVPEAIYFLEKAVQKYPSELNHTIIFNLVELYNLYSVKKNIKKELLLVRNLAYLNDIFIEHNHKIL